MSEARERITHEVLNAILGRCSQNNPRDGVTGVLLCDEYAFCQLLEGPEDKVKERYEVIGRDSRHCAVTLLTSEPAEKREFPDWSMGRLRTGSTLRRLDPAVEEMGEAEARAFLDSVGDPPTRAILKTFFTVAGLNRAA